MFYKSLLLVGIFIVTAFYVPFLRRYKRVKKPTKLDYIALFIVLLFASLNFIFMHDTFFGGRDPGVFANAAVYLAEHRSLMIDQFINFPGWIQIGDSFQIGFHFGYISWLVTHYSLLGMMGIKLSNFIPLTISLLSIYFICRRVVSSRTGIAAILMFATTYPMFWFTRGTYNEIFSMALIWFGILCFLIAYEKKENKYLVASILSFGLFLHTRVEGIAIFGMFILITVLLHFFWNEKWIFTRKHVILLLAISLHFICYSVYILPFYFPVYSDVLRHFGLLTTPPSLTVETVNPSALRYHFTDFVFRMLSKYNLYWVILFIPLTILTCLHSKYKNSKVILMIFLLVAPIFIYLKTPFVTLDQPWFLRRYIFTILPAAFLFTAIFLFKVLDTKKYRLILISTINLIIIINLATAAPIILHREYTGMINNVEDISSKFSENDLILVDRYATGNYKLADPMYCLFNRYALWVGCQGDWCSMDELRLRADFTAFPDIYILTSSESTWLISQFPNESLELVFEKSVKYKELEWTVNLIHLPGRPPDMYDINYSIVKDLIGVPQKINEKEYLIQVYRVDSDYFKEKLEWNGDK